MATTDTAYYLVTWLPEYARLVGVGDGRLERVLVSVPEGGFTPEGADVLRHVKERFLESELEYQGIELDRTVEVFDRLFTIVEIEQVVELD